MRIKLERSNLIVKSEHGEHRPLCVHALITSLLMCKWYLGEKKQLRVFFKTRAEGGSLAANKTTNAHSLQFPPLPACSALLCSFTTPSLLSVCLSLQQKHSSAECGGMGAQTQSLSLPLSLSVNIELSCTGEKPLICSR